MLEIHDDDDEKEEEDLKELWIRKEALVEKKLKKVKEHRAGRVLGMVFVFL